MTRDRLTALGIWMLEHLAGASYYEELAGDLLEQLGDERPGWWYWRQVLGAVGLGIWEKTRRLGSPLVFSALWSVAYELYWQRAGGDQASQSLAVWLKGLNLAYSSAFGVAAEALPLVVCVWTGLLVYLLTRRSSWRSISMVRLTVGLSISLNAVLVGSVVLRRIAGVYVREQGAMGASHPVVAGLATGLALFFGLVFVVEPFADRTAGPLRG